MATFPRSAWGAKPPKWAAPPIHLVPYGVVHHIGGGDAYPLNVVATLQAIQSMEQHGAYDDIAYCWGVDKDGNIWELRGDVADGATLGYSGQSLSVLAICNAAAPNFVATPAMIAGIAACFKAAQSRGTLKVGAYIDGHHWFDTHETSAPTDCPGPPLIAQIPQIRTLVDGPVPTPTPPKPQEEPMLIPSPSQVTPNRFDGVKIDVGAQTIITRGAGACVPNPNVIGNKPWDGVFSKGKQPDGFEHFVVVTTDLAEYEFHVK